MSDHDPTDQAYVKAAFAEYQASRESQLHPGPRQAHGRRSQGTGGGIDRVRNILDHPEDVDLPDEMMGGPRLPDEAYAAEVQRGGSDGARAEYLRSQLRRLDEIEPALTCAYLVKGWLSRGGLSMLYGPSNAGKTFVALDMALHIAAGQPWRGCRVNGGPVVYIAAEGGSGVRNRLAAFKRENPGMSSAAFTLLPLGLDLHARVDALALCEAITAERPALVVVDTLARSMGMGDENAAKDAALFVRNCDLIREKVAAHVLVVHHTGKDEDRGARGSSALRAAVDTEIAVTSEGEIVCRKQRDMAYAETLHFTLRGVALGQDEDGDPVTSAVVEAAEPRKPRRKPLSGKNEVAMQALLDALRDHGTTKAGDGYPHNRKVVHIDRWREACGVHGLTSGVADSSARMAFKRAKDSLMDKDEVREWGEHVWRVQDDD